MRGAFWILLAFAGCNGGLHRRGERQAEVLASYGIPVGDGALWWNGSGEARNAGLSVNSQWLVRDRVAITAGLTPIRVYQQQGETLYQAEIQAGARYYAWEFEIAGAPIALYGEVLGGTSYASEPFPPGGRHWNLSMDIGGGFEIHLSKRLRWMVGYRLRHQSDGRGSIPENPGQNDHLVYTGIAIPW